MSPHTPGPRKAERHGVVSAVIGERRVQAALATGDAPMRGDTQASPEAIQAANARLIAAAPDLLRVAELALGVAMRRPHDGSQLDEDLEGLLLEARAAIAKATGATITREQKAAADGFARLLRPPAPEPAGLDDPDFEEGES